MAITDREALLRVQKALAASPIFGDLRSTGVLCDAIAEALLDAGIDPHTGKEISTSA